MTRITVLDIRLITNHILAPQWSRIAYTKDS